MPLTSLLTGLLQRLSLRTEATDDIPLSRQTHPSGRVDAAEALRESERRLADAERLAHVGWSEIDFVTGRLVSSPEAWRIFGVNPSDDGADDWNKWRNVWPEGVHPDDRARVTEAYAAALAGGPRLDQEYRMFRPSGEIRTVHVETDITFDEDGRAQRQFTVIQDITDLRRAEDERRKVDDALRDSQERLRQAQKMEAVGRLAGGVAHDFNNLLMVINGCSELVFTGLRPDDPNRELLAEIRHAGDRAATLTSQLLAFSRRQVLQPDAVDLNALITDLRKLLIRLIGEHIEVTCVSQGRAAATVDPMQFEQAMINLAVNARDAMPAGGELRIETREPADDDAILRRADARPGSYVMVTVTDSGHGMNESAKSRIFEPFFTTKEPGKGTGLGLAMVYGFVKQSGGHIGVDTAVGRGTTFMLYLPRAEKEPKVVRPLPPTGAAPDGTETILLVEDEDAVRSLSRLALQASGYTVLEARNGQEGLLVAQQHSGPIHLLVTDVVMPHMSGPQLADELSAVRPQMRTLFISGYTDEAIKFEADRRFLQKPFAPMTLARKARELLDYDRTCDEGPVLRH